MACCATQNLALNQEIKLVVVGDGAIGKTCMLVTFKTNNFPEEYIPTIFENYLAPISVNGQSYELDLWDTAGQEEFERLRPLSYDNADVFLVCFAINSPPSLDNIKLKWIPELRKHAPHTPFVLVALKADLRKDEEAKEKFRSKTGRDFLRYDDGSGLARDLRASSYHECSAKEHENLDRIFKEAVVAALEYRSSSQIGGGGSQGGCILM